MIDPPEDIKWTDRVARVRAFLASGFYDDPEILIDVARDRRTNKRLLKDLLKRLDNCVVGDGPKYEAILQSLLLECFGAAVDATLVNRRFEAEGGWGDIELPLRTEDLSRYPLWGAWSRQYGIKTIIVEAKNRKAKAKVADVFQILGYLTVSGRGRFGILVSRNGFSRNALATLRFVARKGRHLVLPLDELDLHSLAQASERGSMTTMEFLRRKETQLLQAA